jgi:hypothetical protein
MEGLRKRRVYASTDNIIADVRCGGHFMGEEFTTTERPSISVKVCGTGNFTKVHVIKDGEYVHTTQPMAKFVDFTWQDDAAVKGKISYYYIRGEQGRRRTGMGEPDVDHAAVKRLRSPSGLSNSAGKTPGTRRILRGGPTLDSACTTRQLTRAPARIPFAASSRSRAPAFRW